MTSAAPLPISPGIRMTSLGSQLCHTEPDSIAPSITNRFEIVRISMMADMPTGHLGVGVPSIGQTVRVKINRGEGFGTGQVGTGAGRDCCRVVTAL